VVKKKLCFLMAYRRYSAARMSGDQSPEALVQAINQLEPRS
jgi:hypothetical protein